MSRIKEKMETGVKGLSKPKLVIMQTMLGFSLGVIVDIIFQFLYWQLRPHFPESLGEWRYGVPTGFSIYYANPAQTIIPWDDVLMIIITAGMLLFGWFRKRFWFIIGFGAGWYVSGNLGLLDALWKPMMERD